MKKREYFISKGGKEKFRSKSKSKKNIRKTKKIVKKNKKYIKKSRRYKIQLNKK